ncbi:MAG: PD40 domain-containing protein [Acidobacteria bacterium]|nr:PD40 domain-containing protein [Acidobacteriota bacterium]
MFTTRLAVVSLTAAFAAAVIGLQPAARAEQAAAPAPAPANLLYPGEERHLANVRQLTNGGENAEAYFSFDGQMLSFQSNRAHACDQIYTMKVDGSEQKLLSSGLGRTTCAHFMPDGKSIVYASTHLGGPDCPPVPGSQQGYVWPIYDSYDIYKINIDGTGLTRLTGTPGYDAEATVAKDGRIVFTSVRDGDMEIYSMNGDGSDVRRLTNRPGPDGGPFFSADGSKIVWRGRALAPGTELDNYFSLLKQGIWRPTALELFVMDRDGSNVRQVTNTGVGANWAPFFTPDGTKIIYGSNAKNPRGNNFDLFMTNVDGTGVEQITFFDGFDGFPMFSPDGTKLVFGSNRNQAKAGDTNVFMAEWRD